MHNTTKVICSSLLQQNFLILDIFLAHLCIFNLERDKVCLTLFVLTKRFAHTNIFCIVAFLEELNQNQQSLHLYTIFKLTVKFENCIVLYHCVKHFRKIIKTSLIQVYIHITCYFCTYNVINNILCMGEVVCNFGKPDVKLSATEQVQQQ